MKFSVILFGIALGLSGIFSHSGLYGEEKTASYTDVPGTIDDSAKYLFYMHGRIVEIQGVNAQSKQHGRYMYDDIVNTFVKRGFVVISKVRTADTRLDSYGKMVANQIKKLLDTGVPPENITVIGHSKGGALTLVASAELGNPGINFVVMAGCGIGKFSEVYNVILKKYATRLKGRILSLYDDADKEAGSCTKAFQLSKGIESKETVFKTKLGHGLFYAPRNEWVDAVVEWATK